MAKRTPRVYYLAERQDRRAILIFDAGYEGGDIYIYEHKETRPVEEIEKEMKGYYRTNKLSEEILKEIVWMWIGKKFGHSMSWKLVSE